MQRRYVIPWIVGLVVGGLLVLPIVFRHPHRHYTVAGRVIGIVLLWVAHWLPQFGS